MSRPRGLHALFSTPLRIDRFGDARLRATVARRLVAEARRSASLERSLVNGWHGAPDLALRDDEIWRTVTRGLVALVRSTMEEWAASQGAQAPDDVALHAQGWGTVMRRGAYALPHHHQDAHWAVVWYPDPGDPPPAAAPDAGALAFIDPRGAVGSAAGLAAVAPARGTAVVFPGWLTHFVHPYAGRRPRVSVAYNVMVRARS